MLRLHPFARRRARIVALLLTGLLAVAACTGSTPARPRPSRPAAPDGRPNIVFVLTDDLSTNLLRYMPHVQALMRRGESFSNYFVVDSLCCPSRSAILTGEFPHSDGVFNNIQPDGGYPAFSRNNDVTKTWGLALQAAGYRTGLMGKYLNQYYPRYGPQRGWNEWDVTGLGYNEYNYELNQDGINVDYGHQPADYLTTVLGSRADSFIDQSAAGQQPFALEVATFAPHLPAVPAPRDTGSFPGLRAPHGPAYDRIPQNSPSWLRLLPPLSASDNARDDRVFRRRVQSVQGVDRLVANLEGRLRARHLLDNTYFVFSSDNGFHIGDHRLLPGKQTAFDTDIHVPLIVAGPGVPAGRTSSAMASEIDLAPTFEKIAGAAPLGNPDGVSLLDLWHGRATPATWQQAVLVEHHGHDFYPGDPDRQPIRSGDPPSYEAIRTGDVTYVEYRNGQHELYDLKTDPYELDNIFGRTTPGAIATLHATLHALATCRGAAQCERAAVLA